MRRAISAASSPSPGAENISKPSRVAEGGGACGKHEAAQMFDRRRRLFGIQILRRPKCSATLPPLAVASDVTAASTAGEPAASRAKKARCARVSSGASSSSSGKPILPLASPPDRKSSPDPPATLPTAPAGTESTAAPDRRPPLRAPRLKTPALPSRSQPVAAPKVFSPGGGKSRQRRNRIEILERSIPPRLVHDPRRQRLQAERPQRRQAPFGHRRALPARRPKDQGGAADAGHSSPPCGQ